MNTTIPNAAASETRLGIAAVLHEHVERLVHARCDPGGGQNVASDDRVAAARDVLHLRLVRVQLEAVEHEHAGDRESDGCDRNRPAVDESRPTAPRSVL